MMLSYFARLILAGITKLALSAFILYSLLIYAPGGTREVFSRLSLELESPVFRGYKEWPASWEFDKPWPVSYFAWLFDPSETKGLDYETGQLIRKGIDMALGAFHVQGSGVLTGDLYQSELIDIGKPVVDFFGPGLDLLFGIISTIIAALMVLVAAQRWRRPQPYRVSALPTSSALVDWWQLHSRSPLDVSILRQF